jgi:phosphoenolpyruvate synthase/pyruvate phosphate dikinase
MSIKSKSQEPKLEPWFKLNLTNQGTYHYRVLHMFLKSERVHKISFCYFEDYLMIKLARG